MKIKSKELGLPLSLNYLSCHISCSPRCLPVPFDYSSVRFSWNAPAVLLLAPLPGVPSPLSHLGQVPFVLILRSSVSVFSSVTSPQNPSLCPQESPAHAYGYLSRSSSRTGTRPSSASFWVLAPRTARGTRWAPCEMVLE